MPNINMAWWDSVASTDPAFTKPLPGAAKLTAVDAYYQLRKMTALWGPPGVKWSYRAEYSTIVFPDGSCAAVADVWLTPPDTEQGASREIGPERSCAPMMVHRRNSPDVADEDCFKKAATNALGKLFSRFGCDSDVYLGVFDGTRPEHTNRPQISETEWRERLTVLTDLIGVQKNLEGLRELWKSTAVTNFRSQAPDEMVTDLTEFFKTARDTHEAINVPEKAESKKTNG